MKLFISILFLSICSATCNYCKIMSCSNPKRHILCLHRDDRVSDQCSIHIYSGLVDFERDILLTVHNTFRGFGLDGQIIKKYEWDDDLELMAQRWANQCRAVKDECRALNKFRSVAYQNIAQIISSTNYHESFKNINFTALVDAWSDIPNNPVIPSNPIYQALDRLGCGLTKTKKCKRASFGRVMVDPGCSYKYFIVCNYARTS